MLMPGKHGGACAGSGRRPEGPFLHGSADGPQILSALTVLSISSTSDRVTFFFAPAGNVSVDNTQTRSPDLGGSAVSGIVPSGSGASSKFLKYESEKLMVCF
jgi:hypothetical protein